MASQQFVDASDTEPSHHRMLECARVVAACLAERAPLVDQTRAIPPDTVRDLHDAGLPAMRIPRAQGGTEIDIVTQLEVLELLGGACASTAWCLANHLSASRKLLSVLGEAAAPYRQAIVHEGAVIAQGITPSDATRAVPGGFLSSGRWPFISFSPHARWVVLDTMVPGPPPDWRPQEGASTPPSTHGRWLIVGMDQLGVRLDPTWRALSLRGSMSHDLILDDVVVPEACAPVSRRPPAEVPWDPQAPRALLFPSQPGSPFLPSIMLGVAQAALRETLVYGREHTMFRSEERRSNMPGHQFAVSDAAMWIEAGRALLYQEARAVLAKAQAGDPFTATDVIRLHMASLVARENAQKAVERLWSVRGAHGLYETDNFERYYRDVRMGTLPAPDAPDRVREQLGKYLFGLPEHV